MKVKPMTKMSKAIINARRKEQGAERKVKCARRRLLLAQMEAKIASLEAWIAMAQGEPQTTHEAGRPGPGRRKASNDLHVGTGQTPGQAPIANPLQHDGRHLAPQQKKKHVTALPSSREFGGQGLSARPSSREFGGQGLSALPSSREFGGQGLSTLPFPREALPAPVPGVPRLVAWFEEHPESHRVAGRSPGPKPCPHGKSPHWNIPRFLSLANPFLNAWKVLPSTAFG